MRSICQGLVHRIKVIYVIFFTEVVLYISDTFVLDIYGNSVGKKCRYSLI